MANTSWYFPQVLSARLHMEPENLQKEVADLKTAFGDLATTMATNGQQLLRIEQVSLPAGCNPSSTPVLLVLQSGRPQIYVKPGIVLPSGATPRSASVVTIEGESWLQFSFSFPWDESINTLVQLVAGSIQRFSLKE